MKKYSKKKKINTSISFETELNNFIKKVTLNVNKTKLKGVLNILIKDIESYGVDMVMLKSRLRENMKGVEFFTEENSNKYSGYYDILLNKLCIVGDNKYKEQFLIESVAHELLHCMSSQREVQYTKGKPGQKNQHFNFYCGLSLDLFNTSGEESDLYNEYFWLKAGSTIFNEGMTEILASSATAKYFGSVSKWIYFHEKKQISQLYATFGKELIKGYFENNVSFYKKMFEPFKNKNIKAYDVVDLKPQDLYKYASNLLLLDQGLEKEDYDNPTFINSSLNLHDYNLKFFQKNLIQQFYEKRNTFLSGEEVKQTLLKSFDMYAKTIDVYMIGGNETYNEIWNNYCDAIDDTYDTVCRMYKKNKKFYMPSISNNEMQQHLEISQKLCKYNYYGNCPLEHINISNMRTVNLEHELEKAEKIMKQNYKMKRYIPKIEHDIWKEWETQQEV